MKITREKLSTAAGRLPANRAAFTLIELLVVIAIMAVLAGFILVVVTQIKKKEYTSVAAAEMAQIEQALEDYKNQYGVYPPSNPANPLTNTLYYELSGVFATNISATPMYETLDNASTVPTADFSGAFFNVGGAINCLKAGDTESAKAKNFLPSLKANRIGIVTNFSGGLDNVLITTVRGPDSRYTPVNTPDVNPFRYVYPGTNNPNSYDLWVQLVFSGRTNLVCNWTKAVIINSPLP
jgi:prepilin-type N-terminal cleavage/methylation domain-containing protein